MRVADKEKVSRNVVANTFYEIAEKERRKAIRNGDYAEAVIASIIQYYVDQAAKNPTNTNMTWSSS